MPPCRSHKYPPVWSGSNPSLTRWATGTRQKSHQFRVTKGSSQRRVSQLAWRFHATRGELMNRAPQSPIPLQRGYRRRTGLITVMTTQRVTDSSSSGSSRRSASSSPSSRGHRSMSGLSDTESKLARTSFSTIPMVLSSEYPSSDQSIWSI